MWAYFMNINFGLFNRIISIMPLIKVIAMAIIINVDCSRNIPTGKVPPIIGNINWLNKIISEEILAGVLQE